MPISGRERLQRQFANEIKSHNKTRAQRDKLLVMLELTLPILDHAAIGHAITQAAKECAQEIRKVFNNKEK